MTARALVFRAGPLLCAVALHQVVETMRPLAVSPVAGAPDHVAGLCVMRGATVPVVDVATLLTGSAGEVSRFVAVTAGSAGGVAGAGHVALATGPVVGVEDVESVAAGGGVPMARPGAVSGVGAVGTEPLLVLDVAALALASDSTVGAVP